MALGMASECTGFLKRSLDMRQTLSASSNLWTYTFLLLFLLIINRTNISWTFRTLKFRTMHRDDIVSNSYNLWGLIKIEFYCNRKQL